MTNTERIACIGAGYWGRNLVRCFNQLGVLACVCEADAGRRSELAVTYPHARITGSLEDVLADREISGVVIATPAETHGELVKQALLIGKDVFVEKPLCLSAREARKLVDLAADRNRILMIGHLLWYHPAVLRLKKLVDDGELGRIQYIYSNRLNLGKIRREENIIWSFAPHDISVILGLAGEMPDEVEARGGNYLHNNIADVTVSLMSFPSGVKAHVFVSWLHPYKEQKLIVVGDRGMAVFDDVAPDNKLSLHRHTISWKNQAPVVSKAAAEPVSVETVEPLLAECSHFLECMRTRKTPRTDGEEALRVLTVLEACQKTLKAETPAAEKSYFAHESAFIDDGAQIGEGTTIWHVSHVMKNVRVGRNCRIGQNVVIGPDVTIGDGVKIQNNVSVYKGVTLEDNVFCGPSMVFTNVLNPRSEVPRMDEIQNTTVKQGASLGANCTVVCGVTIGRHAFVGAAAVVTKDVADFALVVGNPARVIGWMCVCGARIRFENGDSRCSDCGRSYRKDGTKVALTSPAGIATSGTQ